MFSAAGSLTSPSGISTIFLGLPIIVLHPRGQRFLQLGVEVVPGVHREFRLGNVVFAALPALLHLLDFHDTNGAEVGSHLAVQAVNQILSPSGVLNTQEFKYGIIQVSSVFPL